MLFFSLKKLEVICWLYPVPQELKWLLVLSRAPKWYFLWLLSASIFLENVS